MAGEGDRGLIRILHLADLHLGYEPPWQRLAEARRRERDARLAKAVAWAIEQDVDLVLIAGDLFETHRPPGPLVETVIGELKRLVDAGIQVVTLPGNHDEISYHDSVYRREAKRWPGLLVENPNMQKVATFDCRGARVHLYSLAYTSGLTRTYPPLAEFPRTEEEGFHVALLHGSLDWNRGDRSLPINGEVLEAAGYDYVALGHIHRHVVRGQRRLVVYPGMIDGKDFDDPGVGYYTLVTLTSSGSELQKVPADGAQPLVTLSVDAGEFPGESELIAALRARLPERGAARVVLTGSPAFAFSAEAMEEALSGPALFVRVDDETEGFAEELIERLASEPTVRGQFVARMLARIQEEPERDRLLRRALARGLEALGRGETAR